MKNSRLLTTALVLGLSVALFVAPACAWEFEMDGVYTWQYEVRGQNGSQGFFGAYDAAQSGAAEAVGFYAPYNFYTGGYHQATVTDANAWTVYAAYGGQAVMRSGGHAVMRSFCVLEPPHRKQRAPLRAR